MSNLKKIRTGMSLSQSELSKQSGVNIRIIQYYEQGSKDINKAQGATLYKLAQVLKCTIEELLELEVK